jgi:hypothetical protein
MNIKSNKWELITVINKANCEESVLKFTLESCVCLFITHMLTSMVAQHVQKHLL